MAITPQGNSGVAAEVETNTRAIRFTPRPTDVGALGSYAAMLTTGTMAAGIAGASPIFSVRWTDASKVMLVRKVSLAFMSLGTGFTTGSAFFEMVCARSFSASDTAGAGVTLTGHTNKRRTSFGSSLIAATEMRISTTATLTAGTRTLDTNPVAGIHVGVPATTNLVILPTTPLWSPDFSGEWPLVFAQNEGFIIRATVPATGTWQADVSLEWTELASF
jgi:hypothetical protein